MAEEKNTNNKDYLPLTLISIVAIVAIMGIAILFLNNRITQPAASAYESASLMVVSGINVAGQMDIANCEAEFNTKEYYLQKHGECLLKNSIAACQSQKDKFDEAEKACIACYNNNKGEEPLQD